MLSQFGWDFRGEESSFNHFRLNLLAVVCSHDYYLLVVDKG